MPFRQINNTFLLFLISVVFTSCGESTKTTSQETAMSEMDSTVFPIEEIESNEFSSARGKTTEEMVSGSNSYSGAAGSLKQSMAYSLGRLAAGSSRSFISDTDYFNTESYSAIDDNQWKNPLYNPLSTFSVDVDAASYSNIRRMINQGQWPVKDAVRIEEMINYFTYDLPDPINGAPFSITTEMATCSWNPDHHLLMVALQGKRIPVADLPPGNLTFLLDVSGSMSEPNKLPLVKSSIRLLVNQMRPQDKISIVVYAGAAGLVLPPTSGSDKSAILAAIDKLDAGGSTAGGEGLKLAYETNKTHFVKNGNNRIILATDGDFNVGPSSDAEMVRLVESYRKSGINLTVLGFGYGNLKDSKMEQIADKGNGHFAYIDNLQEAKKVFLNELGATLLTLATDVKLQVEFNPAKVKGYRLVGYENRVLQTEDFNDDTKDAGEIGAGHSVTAFYEVIPVGSASSVALPVIDSLRYQQTPKAMPSDEWATVKFRYKPTVNAASKLLSKTLKGDGNAFNSASPDFRFAASVAEFGMILRDSEYKGKSNLEHVLKTAKAAKGKDREGYRDEFIRLVEMAGLIQPAPVVSER